MRRFSDVARELQKALNSARGDKGWSQRKLAGNAGVSVDTIQKIESGRVSPTVSILERIAGALGVPVASLLGGGCQEAHPGWSALGKSERALIGALIDRLAGTEVEAEACAVRRPPTYSVQVDKALARDASRDER